MQEGYLEQNSRKIFTVSHAIGRRKNVLLLHGYAEHIMRYKRFMGQLDKAGYGYLGYDHKGHGKSGGKRALIKDFDEYVEDLRMVILETFQKGNSNFIYAHSMGSLVLLLYLQKYGDDLLTGVVLSGTALQMYEKTPAWLESIASYIAAIFPSFPTLPVDSSTVSRDAEIVKKYNEDALVFRGNTKAALGHAFLSAQKKALKSLQKIKTPIYINHGTADKLIHPEGAKTLMDGIASTDKSLKMWEGLYHEILNEPEKDEVAASIIAWMDKRSIH